MPVDKPTIINEQQQSIPTKQKRSASLQPGSSAAEAVINHSNDKKLKIISEINAPPIRTVSTEFDTLPPMTQISESPSELTPITKTDLSMLPGIDETSPLSPKSPIKFQQNNLPKQSSTEAEKETAAVKKSKPSSIAIELDFNPSPPPEKRKIMMNLPSPSSPTKIEQQSYSQSISDSPITESKTNDSKIVPETKSIGDQNKSKIDSSINPTSSPKPISNDTSSSNSELSNRTISLSDPDLYYLSLPPNVKIGNHQHGNAKPIQPKIDQTSKMDHQQQQQQTSKDSTSKKDLTAAKSIAALPSNQQGRPPPLLSSISRHKSVANEIKYSPYSTVRSIRFEHPKYANSKSMRTLSFGSQQQQHSKTISTPKHHQSTLIKFTPETATIVPIADRTVDQKSRYDIRQGMRYKSTNLSHLQMAYHSESDISDQTIPEINNNYLDNNNASDNEAMAILPIEARELLMQEEEDRKSRLAKESTSLLRIPNLGARRESKFFPGRIRKRVILKNGNINLCPEHVDKRSRRYLQDTFTTMVDIRWRWNLLVFAMGFLISWFGFSIIWWLIAFSHSDFEHLHDEQWTPCVANLKNFPSALLFSIETQHTIGYGSRYTTEECPEALFLMMLQSITGVMIQCFMVGFIFAKLSRPQKRSQTLMFSRYAIVNTRDGQMCLMFRVGDLRDRSHIIGTKISAQLIRKKMTNEGEIIPYFHQKLSVKFDEIDDEVFLIWPAIIVHVIDENSPFYKMNVDDMTREKFEIIAILEGTVESTGQSIQARTSYLPSEILWGHRFEQLIRYRHDTGEYLVDYSKFNNTFDVDTPLCSAKELKEELEKQKQMNTDDDDDSEQGGNY
ncbi:uncharacterized protein LOC113792718 [Dermatophagoides pteronyssinus]|uniref:uncharacterized protein LOC113792718 n=1 Tax=Dermatophagoides pteronyssinus TaxID=6956 RepID=UPI003F67359F